jgi:hypothetical protein
MKYEKPEMEVMKFKEEEVFTMHVSGPEGGQAGGSGTGNGSWATP